MYSEFLSKHGWKYVPGFIFLFISAYIQTLSPKVLGWVFDAFTTQPADKSQIYTYVVYLILIGVGMFITRFIWRMFIIVNSRNLECMLRRQLFFHFQKLDQAFFNQQKSGDLMAYAINDISAVRMAMGPAIAQGISGIAIAILSVGYMWGTINARLTLFVMLPLPIIIGVIFFMGIEVRKRFTVVQKTFATVSDRVNENVGGIRVVKAYVQENSEIDRFEELNSRMMGASVRMVRVSSLVNPLTGLLFGISFAVSMIYGAGQVQSGLMTVGDFVAFNGFLAMIIQPVMMLGRITNNIQRGLASHKRLKTIFMTQPILKGGKNRLKNPKGALKVDNLTFHYPNTEKPALENVSFELRPGETLGIIGKTGSGKSTIANALLKTYNVPDGTIYMDGVDINTLTLDDVREPYGYIPQDGFLFSATIEENIKLFEPDYTLSQVMHAAEQSDLKSTIESFPQQYQTMLGERGVNLSGGQKQRVAIARALVKGAPIYILDDALAAVDTSTEKTILENLKSAFKGHSAILIAHRVSVVMNADQILVMDEGRVVERGNHDELIAENGLYAELYTMQSGEEEENE